MKLLKGQRWGWGRCKVLYEILEDSAEFDPTADVVEISLGLINGDKISMYFGKGVQGCWKYLEGQDRPHN